MRKSNLKTVAVAEKAVVEHSDTDLSATMVTVENESDLTPAEFLSGVRKGTRLHPCITIVLYFGDDWDAANCLHEMLDFSSIPDTLRQYVNDYNIYLVEVSKLRASDTYRFKTDLRQVFDCIRMVHDKDGLHRLVWQDEAYQRLDEDAYDMISRYTNMLGEIKIESKYITEEGKVNMCKAMQELLADERAAGIVEGISQGETRMETLMKLLLDTQCYDEVARATSDKDYRQQLYQQYGIA